MSKIYICVLVVALMAGADVWQDIGTSSAALTEIALFISIVAVVSALPSLLCILAAKKLTPKNVGIGLYRRVTYASLTLSVILWGSCLLEGASSKERYYLLIPEFVGFLSVLLLVISWAYYLVVKHLRKPSDA
ncbi:hypothetical protein [Agarivorans sp. Alg241-V36]|uniref:hypothetical protein n=1 Tax=Agarivorans sp. Alg241-V36 TaxID=2305992 RepID=UPI0013D05398|nr:hypothetical protein [Agarivorans sp. Alg241-V36]